MKKIYVGNLSFKTTEEELQAAFAPFGAIHSVSVVKDRDSGRPRGFAFVEMESDDEAQAAIQGLNGKEIGGRVVVVNEAKSQESGEGGGERRERRGGGDGGRRGGNGGGGRGRGGSSRFSAPSSPPPADLGRKYPPENAPPPDPADDFGAGL